MEELSRVGGFVEALRERVRQARVRVRAAERAGDAYERAVAEDERDDALRIARAHGVDVAEEGDGVGSAV
ncbi:hypothetical protein [Streptomyces acidiscabies]|uniref:Uncharacterized protein n=1 Tax=Streptomyces acidiscabies TaxID=42234 RepID=A0AAP6BMC0_9ACTN|nr:hypothetical protein [Streptomyces acidiscabies]MDX2967193.1 hypothetical protein [Streptomyces acidiscabies]MDX3025907.1 hypothetical protein [Streptomyces acidiscabies]MDX3796831.1 hypothetical protein [Streptomyces acidiscabies]GAQ58484.1 hypothetical protein a10_08374 [Streptomyces acidiscabies]GAV45617.1 hypothetical protein Saa2_08608 [Streptomyces acidiscabies]